MALKQIQKDTDWVKGIKNTLLMIRTDQDHDLMQQLLNETRQNQSLPKHLQLPQTLHYNKSFETK